MKQLVFQILGGFSMKDIPFLLLQLTISSLLVWIIRVYWRKRELPDEEKEFLKYLIPLQIIFTTLAIFSLRSPWMIIFLGIVSLVPVLGTTTLSLRSKFFYLLSVFIAFGCGAANIIVTALVTFFLVVPVLQFYSK